MYTEVTCDKCGNEFDIDVYLGDISIEDINAYLREFIFEEGETLNLLKQLDLRTLSNTEKENILSYIKGELE